MTGFYLPIGHTGTVCHSARHRRPGHDPAHRPDINARIHRRAGRPGRRRAAIGALAFFIYAYYLVSHNYIDVANTPTLLTAALAGACIGFLPHNLLTRPIFMALRLDAGGAWCSRAARDSERPAPIRQSFGRAARIAAAAAAVSCRIAVLGIRSSTCCWRLCAGSAAGVAVRAGQGAPAPPHARDRPHASARGVALYSGPALLGSWVALSPDARPVAVISVLSALAAIGLLMVGRSAAAPGPGRHAAGRHAARPCPNRHPIPSARPA